MTDKCKSTKIKIRRVHFKELQLTNKTEIQELNFDSKRGILYDSE